MLQQMAGEAQQDLREALADQQEDSASLKSIPGWLSSSQFMVGVEWLVACLVGVLDYQSPLSRSACFDAGFSGLIELNYRFPATSSRMVFCLVVSHTDLPTSPTTSGTFVIYR